MKVSNGAYGVVGLESMTVERKFGCNIPCRRQRENTRVGKRR